MANNEEIKIEGGKIDVDVLDILKNEKVLKSLRDDKLVRRLEFNFFCELLGEMKKLTAKIDDFANTISIVSVDKLAEFFNGVKKGFTEEKKHAEIQEKIHQSHKKPKKINKN